MCHLVSSIAKIITFWLFQILILDSTPVDERIWYLLHHGVYHSTKSNKICVLFDCTAEHARSIKKELLAGPDLNNQIIGTLIRFLQEKMAFVADKENIFFKFWSALNTGACYIFVVARWGPFQQAYRL